MSMMNEIHQDPESKQDYIGVRKRGGDRTLCESVQARIPGLRRPRFRSNLVIDKKEPANRLPGGTATEIDLWYRYGSSRCGSTSVEHTMAPKCTTSSFGQPGCTNILHHSKNPMKMNSDDGRSLDHEHIQRRKDQDRIEFDPWPSSATCRPWRPQFRSAVPAYSVTPEEALRCILEVDTATSMEQLSVSISTLGTNSMNLQTVTSHTDRGLENPLQGDLTTSHDRRGKTSGKAVSDPARKTDRFHSLFPLQTQQRPRCTVER